MRDHAASMTVRSDGPNFDFEVILIKLSKNRRRTTEPAKQCPITNKVNE